MLYEKSFFSVPCQSALKRLVARESHNGNNFSCENFCMYVCHALQTCFVFLQLQELKYDINVDSSDSNVIALNWK